MFPKFNFQAIKQAIIDAIAMWLEVRRSKAMNDVRRVLTGHDMDEFSRVIDKYGIDFVLGVKDAKP